MTCVATLLIENDRVNRLEGTGSYEVQITELDPLIETN